MFTNSVEHMKQNVSCEYYREISLDLIISAYSQSSASFTLLIFIFVSGLLKMSYKSMNFVKIYIKNCEPYYCEGIQTHILSDDFRENRN